jgi:hypothetical protein
VVKASTPPQVTVQLQEPVEVWQVSQPELVRPALAVMTVSEAKLHDGMRRSSNSTQVKFVVV